MYSIYSMCFSTNCRQYSCLKAFKKYMTTKTKTRMSCWQLNSYTNRFNASDLTLNNECDVPVINKPNDMLIKVLSSSVNPIDIAMSSGYGSSLLSLLQLTTDLGIDSITYDRLPLILGRDFCGVVVSCGQAVNRFQVGDNVWGALPPFSRNGSHSEFIIANECHVYRKPSNLSAIESASIPYVGLTAWAAVCTFADINQSNALGKRALVLGGSGGVGTFAIQLLKSWGCNVTTTCSGDAIEFVYDNTGADLCIDYNTNELTSSLGSFDFILDASTSGQHRDQIAEFAIKYLRKWKDAKYVTLSSPLLRNTDQFGLVLGTTLSAIQASKETINGLKEGKSVRWAFFCTNGNALKTITELVEKCKIRPVIDNVIKFNDLPLAYVKVSEGHARGKTVIDFT